MAINFPDTPSDGDTVTVGTSTYTYSSSVGAWNLSTSVVVGPTGPAGTIGDAVAGSFLLAGM